MRIAIDASAVPRQMAGAGVYTYQLVRALAELPGEQELFVFARDGLFDDLADLRPQLHVIHIDPPSRAARLLWEQTALPLALRRLRVDVLHSPHHHTPLASGAGFRRVVTIHDVTFLLLPERYPLVRRLYMEGVTRASARIADGVITPSHTVRTDVIGKLGVSGERIVAIPEAAGPQFRPIEDDAVSRMRDKYRLAGRYLLSVGTLEPGKNRGRLLCAYARLRSEGLDCPLAIAGQPGWHYRDDFELVAALGLEGDVTFLDFVPDKDLPALYSGAALLAFPSLYEGFGLPVLEAMACGTPVVTANVSAPAEVAGDAALLVDPRDIEALAGAMGRVLSDDALSEELRARGLERARRFSWQRTARDTLSVYQIVVAQQ